MMSCQLCTTLLLLLSSIETASSFTVNPIHHHAVITRVNTQSRSVKPFLKAAKDDIATKEAAPPKRRNFVHIYTDYASRLWSDTNPEARTRIANDKAATLIRQVQKIVKQDDYMEFSDVSDEAREELVAPG
jgi:hypothetical protein